MEFGAFKKSAFTTLLGHQLENGSWLNDQSTTASAIDALSEECGGPDPVCRFSGLHARVRPQDAPRDWPFRFSWGLNADSDDPKAAYVAAVYHALGFGHQHAWRESRIDAAAAWTMSKWSRFNVLTDTDFQLHLDTRALSELATDESWLLAYVGFSELHRNAYIDQFSKEDILDRPDVPGRVEKLLSLMAGDHWEARAISPEEATAITGEYIVHDCTLRLCEHAKRNLDLARACEASVKWLLGQQSSSGAWINSPPVTAHCLKFVDAALMSLAPEHDDRAPYLAALSQGVEYLLCPSSQKEWCSLGSYEEIDVLATLVRLSKSPTSAVRAAFDKRDVDGSMYAPDVFISYGGPDAHFATKLAKYFEANGVRVWFAEWDLDYGEDVVQAIERGLMVTKKFVIVLSPEAIQRPWVKKELSAAFQQALGGEGKLIIPVMYRRCQPPPFLAAHRWADFTDDQQYSERVRDLLRRLKGRKPLRG